MHKLKNTLDAQQPDTQKNERPILFSTEMVKAILSDSKIMTRRIVKDKQSLQTIEVFQGKNGCENLCPYGKIGDIIWVRESFNITDPNNVISGEYVGDETGYLGSIEGKDVRWRYVYKASSPAVHPVNGKCRWKPSIHMPKEAARIWLKITNVKVERLHDITESDAIAEGVQSVIADRERFGCRAAGMKLYRNYERIDNSLCIYPCNGFENAEDSFKSLWIKINGCESWNFNPWVWVIEFEVISKTGR